MRTAEYDEIQETLEEIAKENSLLKEKAKVQFAEFKKDEYA